MNELKKRILEISVKHKLAHVGSNLTAVNILDEIAQKAWTNKYVVDVDSIIVSAGHAGLALFVVREKYLGDDAEFLLQEHGIHAPMFGSLGHGIGIAVGKALADRSADVYCLISDGECMEGSVWEALRLANKFNLFNL